MNERDNLEVVIIRKRDLLKKLKRKGADQTKITELSSHITRLTSRLLTLDNFKPIDIAIDHTYKVYTPEELEELQAQEESEKS